MSHPAPVQIPRRTTLISSALIAVAVGAFIAAPRAADPLGTDWPSYNRTLTSQR